MIRFADKMPAEIKTVALDFSGVIPAGDSIASMVAVMAVLSGTDASPSSLLSGAPVKVGDVVTQKVVGGVVGVDYELSITVTTTAGLKFTSSGLLSVVDHVSERSLLFIRDLAVDRMRTDHLSIAANAYAFLSSVSDTTIWQKLKAAEARAARLLGVPLGPTEVFTDPPTEAELVALNGKPYLVEPGYDMPPDYFSMSKWGMLRLRQRPVIAIKSFRLVYPNQAGASFTVPLDWVRVDHKYGQLIVSPSANSVTAPYSLFVMQALSSGMNVPDMIRVRYEAGLSSAHELYPDVVDLVYRLAVVLMLKSAFLPQSESVSADGFSQSSSVDIGKLEGGIEEEIKGLSETLIGMVWGVL